MRRVDHAAADDSAANRRSDRRRHRPLEREHGADDVDDRVERADFVEVHLLDRHLVNRRLGFGESLEQCFRPVAAGGRERGLVDQREDLRQAAMVVMTPRLVADARWGGTPVIVITRMSVRMVGPVTVLAVAS